MSPPIQTYTPRATRHSFRCPIQFECPGLTGKGTVIDISPSGLKVFSPIHPMKWTELSLTLLLPKDLPLVFSGATVRWSIGDVFGVTFSTVPDATQTRLNSLLSTLEHAPAAGKIEPMHWGSVDRHGSARSWLITILIGSLLAGSVALGLVYYGRAFYGYHADFYEPKDEEREREMIRKDQVNRAKRAEVNLPR